MNIENNQITEISSAPNENWTRVDDYDPAYIYKVHKGKIVKTDEEPIPPAPTEEELAEFDLEDLRRERDLRLRACDWVTLKAYSQNTPVPTEWAEYQQALRDITNTYSNIREVVWPTKP